MQSLRKLPIQSRLWLILAVAVAMLVSLGLLMLQQINSDLYSAKVQKTQHVVQSAAGVLTYFQSLEAAGTLTREQAQKQAMETVRGLRYDKGDYFWINDLGPKMIMHPMNAKLEGQDLSGLKDPDGKFLFNEMVAIAKAKGAGMVEYRWPKPGASDPVPKISYVQLFEPWGWLVGSGVYIDDMQAEFREQALRASAMGLAIAVLMSLLVLYISRSITRPLREVVNAMENIASGEGDLTRTLASEGNDELATLARHFNTFTNKLRQVISQMLQAAAALNQSADTLGGVATKSQQDSQQQALQMEQVATAINEVTYAVQDVAKNAEQASGEVQGAENNAKQGQANIDRSLQQIDQLSVTIGKAVEVIQTLAQET
ncbi:MAG: methyl-accepting chemotaxis protein, partial [Pseudomonas sp.]|uniref:cache domain-containing protein n=1 Tax=Pseudomonas sp. TaxID=306 RepID=UPI0030F19A4D